MIHSRHDTGGTRRIDNGTSIMFLLKVLQIFECRDCGWLTLSIV